jgi:hypothetical protein
VTVAMSRTLLRGAQVITMSPQRPDAERIDAGEFLGISDP